MMAAAQERWTVLAGIPNVVEEEEADRIIGPGKDISVVQKELPLASVVTVRHRVSSPSSSSPFVYPYIAAADRSGLLLLRATRHVVSFQSKISYHVLPPRYVMTSSHFIHAWQYDPASNRPADFVPTCLRKKEFTAMSRLFTSKFPKIKIARKVKRSRNSVTRQQMQSLMTKLPSHVLKRRGVPAKDLNRLALLTLNE